MMPADYARAHELSVCGVAATTTQLASVPSRTLGQRARRSPGTRCTESLKQRQVCCTFAVISTKEGHDDSYSIRVSLGVVVVAALAIGALLMLERGDDAAQASPEAGQSRAVPQGVRDLHFECVSYGVTKLMNQQLLVTTHATQMPGST